VLLFRTPNRTKTGTSKQAKNVSPFKARSLGQLRRKIRAKVETTNDQKLQHQNARKRASRSQFAQCFSSFWHYKRSNQWQMNQSAVSEIETPFVDGSGHGFLRTKSTFRDKFCTGVLLPARDNKIGVTCLERVIRSVRPQWLWQTRHSRPNWNWSILWAVRLVSNTPLAQKFSRVIGFMLYFNCHSVLEVCCSLLPPPFPVIYF